jgi:uncharacterized protein (DUF433 family)
VSFNTTWTDEQQAELARLAACGARVIDIAAALGFTRNAVIGRARRTGVSLLYRTPPAEPKPVRAPRPPPAPHEPRFVHPQETKDRVRALYLAGEKYTEITRLTGIASGNFVAWIRDLPKRRITRSWKRYDVTFKIAAVAAILTGESYAKASRRLGVEEKSILTWKKRPDVFAAATALAERIKANFAAEQERQRQLAEAEAELERVRVTAHNEPIFAQMSLRHRNILQRRVSGETLEAIGNDYGVSRERIRQIEVKWRAKGLEVPGAKPLSDAALRMGVYVPTGKPRAPKAGRAPVNFWGEAHAILAKRRTAQRGPYNLTDEDRQRRAERLALARTHRWEARA